MTEDKTQPEASSSFSSDFRKPVHLQDRNPAYLYDAVMVYLKAIAHVTKPENRKGLSIEEAISNGSLIFEAVRNTTFESELSSTLFRNYFLFSLMTPLKSKKGRVLGKPIIDIAVMRVNKFDSHFQPD